MDEKTRRYERLAKLGFKGTEISTPDGEARMSEVIIELAKPLIKKHAPDPKRASVIVELAIAAWNNSMLPEKQQPIVEKEIINGFVPKDGSAVAVAVVGEVMDVIAMRRLELFPDLKKVIVDHEITFTNGQLNLNVTSAPIPNSQETGT